MRLWTIGHSTRTHDEFFPMLETRGIDLLVDVRSYPSSKYNPQWNRINIIRGLPSAIQYLHLRELGGKRKALPIHESLNIGLRNASFRGYADYMQTGAFEAALWDLIDLMGQSNLVIMCSEAVWWRCHRSMIADALVAQGYEVTHIMGLEKEQDHPVREFVRVEDGRLTYPKMSDEDS